MFGHAHGDDLVISLRFVHLAIITYVDVTAIFQSCLLDPLASQFGLLGTEGDAVCLHAIVLSGIDDQRAPTAADIQQTLPRLQAQLAAKVLELLFLGRLQVVIRCSKVGAGVDHTFIQPERIEFVGAVVVMVGGLAITPFRVA